MIHSLVVGIQNNTKQHNIVKYTFPSKGKRSMERIWSKWSSTEVGGCLSFFG